jgi:hypothetical protein
MYQKRERERGTSIGVYDLSFSRPITVRDIRVLRVSIGFIELLTKNQNQQEQKNKINLGINT